MLVDIPGIRDIGLTTNGMLLADQAQALYDAGLRRINVSLDTLDPGPLPAVDAPRRPGQGARRASGGEAGRLSTQSRSTPSASAASPSMDVVPLARFAREHGLEMRFIEYMPIGADAWEREQGLFRPRDPGTDRARGRPAGAGGRLRSARAGDGFRLHRRRRPGGHHRLGVAAVLPELQPPPPDGRGQAAQLPVRARRGGREGRCCAAGRTTRRWRR